MKKLLLILIITILSISVYAVDRLNVPIGKYIVFNWEGLKTEISEKTTEAETIEYDTMFVSISVVDTVFYSTDFTRTSGDIGYVAFARGSTTSVFTITTDSLIVGAYGSGLNPIISTVEWSTTSYPNIEFMNVTVGESISGSIFYVSNEGDDSDDGMSIETAWETVSKVNNATFAVNDGVLFKRGDEWYESLVPPSDNLTFDAYGSGENPILNGSKTVNGWIQDVDYVFNFNQITNTEFDDDLDDWILYDVASPGVSNLDLDTVSPINSPNSVTIEVTTAGDVGSSASVFQNTPFDMSDGYEFTWGFKYRVNSGTCVVQELYFQSGVINQTLTGSGIFTYTSNYDDSYNSFNLRFVGSNVFDVTIDSIFITPTTTPDLEVWYVGDNEIVGDGYLCLFDDIFGDRKGTRDEFTENHQYYSKNDSMWICVENASDTTTTYVPIADYYQIYINGRDSININNLNVKRNGVHNVLITGTSSNINISDCRITQAGAQGVEINSASSSVVLNGNYIGENKNDGVYINTGADTANIEVSNCTLNDNGQAGTSDRQEIGIWNTGGVDIIDNEMYHNRNSIVMECVTDGAIYRTGEVNVLRNIIKIDSCSAHALHYFKGNYNVSYNVFDFSDCNIADRSAVYTGEGSAPTNLNYYNNTIINPEIFVDMYLFTTVSGNSNFTFKNNLLYDIDRYTAEYTSNAIDSLSQYMEFDYNLISDTTDVTFLWNGTTYDFTDWQTNSSQDANSVVGNPLFEVEFTDLQLQTGSPAINAGVDVGLTKDILGNPIVGNPDIGAYEKQ